MNDMSHYNYETNLHAISSPFAHIKILNDIKSLFHYFIASLKKIFKYFPHSTRMTEIKKKNFYEWFINEHVFFCDTLRLTNKYWLSEIPIWFGSLTLLKGNLLN